MALEDVNAAIQAQNAVAQQTNAVAQQSQLLEQKQVQLSGVIANQLQSLRSISEDRLKFLDPKEIKTFQEKNLGLLSRVRNALMAVELTFKQQLERFWENSAKPLALAFAGAGLGALVAGPIGAAVGGVIGATFGGIFQKMLGVDLFQLKLRREKEKLDARINELREASYELDLLNNDLLNRQIDLMVEQLASLDGILSLLPSSAEKEEERRERKRRIARIATGREKPEDLREKETPSKFKEMLKKGVKSVAGFLATPAGIATVAATTGALMITKDIADVASALTSSDPRDKVKAEDVGGVTGGLAGALGGAAAGAAIGSIIPFVGTTIGAIIGAGIGAIGGNLLGTVTGGILDSPELNAALIDLETSIQADLDSNTEKMKTLEDLYRKGLLSDEQYITQKQELENKQALLLKEQEDLEKVKLQNEQRNLVADQIKQLRDAQDAGIEIDQELLTKLENQYDELTESVTEATANISPRSREKVQSSFSNAIDTVGNFFSNEEGTGIFDLKIPILGKSISDLWNDALTSISNFFSNEEGTGIFNLSIPGIGLSIEDMWEKGVKRIKSFFYDEENKKGMLYFDDFSSTIQTSLGISEEKGLIDIITEKISEVYTKIKEWFTNLIPTWEDMKTAINKTIPDAAKGALSLIGLDLGGNEQATPSTTDSESMFDSVENKFNEMQANVLASLTENAVLTGLLSRIGLGGDQPQVVRTGDTIVNQNTNVNEIKKPVEQSTGFFDLIVRSLSD